MTNVYKEKEKWRWERKIENRKDVKPMSVWRL